MANSDFDIDFRFGKDGEDTVANILSVETVEVKRDDKWFSTGNLYIETECYYNRSNSWQPSGLSVTKASHWAFVLDDLVIMFPTDKLKKVVELTGRPAKCNIEPNPSQGMLITIADLTNHVKFNRDI